MKLSHLCVFATLSSPLIVIGGDGSTAKDALAWLHTLPKLGGGVNKGLDPDRFKKLKLEDLKSVKDVVLGGHPYLPSGKLGGHLHLPDADYRHLVVLTSLENLRFPENDLGDEALSHIGKIQSLKSLQLMENKISNDGLKHLAALKNLTHLDLRWNKQLDDGCVENLSRLSGLKELNVFKTTISPAGVKKLRDALPQCNVVDTKAN